MKNLTFKLHNLSKLELRSGFHNSGNRMHLQSPALARQGKGEDGYLRHWDGGKAKVLKNLKTSSNSYLNVYMILIVIFM